MTVHIIWLGSKVPEKYKKNIRSYEKFYDVKLWTNPIEMINGDLFNRAKHYALKADIMRLELLMQYGGLYTDIDSYVIRPLPIESDLVCMTSASGYIANETIYAKKEHPAIIESVKALKSHVQNLKGDVNIWDIAGATYITPIFKKYQHTKLPHSIIGKKSKYPRCIRHTYDGSWVTGRKDTKHPLKYWLNE